MSQRDQSASSLVERIGALELPLLLAFDVDGTLAPIVSEPDAARVPASLGKLLGELVRLPGVRVAFVTGRDAATLRSVIAVPGTWRAVEHGRRVLAPGERPRPLRLAPEDRERLDAFCGWAKGALLTSGAHLEVKEGAVAVHVRRLAGRDPEAAARLLETASRRARRSGLAVRRGRAVCEVEVEPGDKGEALDRLIHVTGARGVLYAGDDVTDYPALRRAVSLGGVGLFVRSPERPRKPRAANAALASYEEVPPLIEALVERLRERAYA